MHAGVANQAIALLPLGEDGLSQRRLPVNPIGAFDISLPFSHDTSLVVAASICNLKPGAYLGGIRDSIRQCVQLGLWISHWGRSDG
jgi:hypothetical protein